MIQLWKREVLKHIIFCEKHLPQNLKQVKDVQKRWHYSYCILPDFQGYLCDRFWGTSIMLLSPGFRSGADPPFIRGTGLLLFCRKAPGKILATHWALQRHPRSPKGEFPTPKPWKAKAKKTWAEENNSAGICYEFFLSSLAKPRPRNGRDRTFCRKCSLKQGE